MWKWLLFSLLPAIRSAQPSLPQLTRFACAHQAPYNPDAVGLRHLVDVFERPCACQSDWDDVACAIKTPLPDAAHSVCVCRKLGEPSRSADPNEREGCEQFISHCVADALDGGCSCCARGDYRHCDVPCANLQPNMSHIVPTSCTCWRGGDAASDAVKADDGIPLRTLCQRPPIERVFLVFGYALSLSTLAIALLLIACILTFTIAVSSGARAQIRKRLHERERARQETARSKNIQEQETFLPHP